MDQPLGLVLTFCRAVAGDAVALASLVFASGRQELDWLLGVPSAACKVFLRRVITTPSGRFSWKRHLVAMIGGQSIAALTVQDGWYNWLDDLYAVHDFPQHFGLHRTPSIIRRGLILESKIPVPTR